MRKRVKIVTIIICVLVTFSICFHFLYVMPIRESAIHYMKIHHDESLEILKKKYNLNEFNDTTIDDYYLASRKYDNKDVISYDEKNELLAFFDAYEDYFNFNILKNRYN